MQFAYTRKLTGLQDYWPVPEPHLTLTPLLVCIHWHKLKIFLSSALVLLSSNAEDGDESDDLVVVEVFRSRILPELEAMRTDVAADIQSSVVRLVLELLCIRQSDQREYLLMHFCDWYQNKPDWKASIEKTLSQLVCPSHLPCVYLHTDVLADRECRMASHSSPYSNCCQGTSR